MVACMSATPGYRFDPVASAEAWEVYQQLVLAELHNPRLHDNSVWREQRDKAFALFRAAFTADDGAAQ